MDDLQHDAPEDSPTIPDESPETSAPVLRTARLLANPRRVRRA